MSDDLSDFTTIPGEESQNYMPGSPADDRYYRRIVFSGLDSACTDTSTVFTLEVVSLITNNSISTETSKYCAGEIPK